MIDFILNNVWSIAGGVLATVVANYIWNRITEAKVLLTKDVERISKKFPGVSLIVNDCITEAKKVVPSGEYNDMVVKVANEVKRAIKGKFDDLVIDLLVKWYIEKRAH